MKAGLLEEIITILSPQIKKNKYGEEYEEWEETYKTRARLIHNNGNRVNSNGEIIFTHSRTFQVRNYVPISDLSRIKWNDDLYRVLDIEPNKKAMILTINTEKIND